MTFPNPSLIYLLSPTSSLCIYSKAPGKSCLLAVSAHTFSCGFRFCHSIRIALQRLISDFSETRPQRCSWVRISTQQRSSPLAALSFWNTYNKHAALVSLLKWPLHSHLSISFSPPSTPRLSIIISLSAYHWMLAFPKARPSSVPFSTYTLFLSYFIHVRSFSYPIM